MGGAVGAWEEGGTVQWEGETVGGGMRRGAGMEVSLWAEEPVACRSHTLLILIVSPQTLLFPIHALFTFRNKTPST